jgi:regulator of sirC expression with transglutaminase-like and TPR domain
VLNHIFFEIHGFNSKPSNNEEVQHFYLSNLLNYKEGNPTSTGLLYLIATQHLDLPVYGVNLPGHLILAYVDDRHKLKNNDGYTRNDVLFYINPYNGGAVFTDNEIDLYIKQVKLKHKENYFLPASNKMIIKRYLTELEKAYSRENNKVKSGYINKLKELFVEKE